MRLTLKLDFCLKASKGYLDIKWCCVAFSHEARHSGFQFLQIPQLIQVRPPSSSCHTKPQTFFFKGFWKNDSYFTRFFFLFYMLISALTSHWVDDQTPPTSGGSDLPMNSFPRSHLLPPSSLGTTPSPSLLQLPRLPHGELSGITRKGF